MPTADSTADRPVGMAYLLGDWATDRWAIAVARRPGDRRLNQICLIFHRRLVARRQPSPADSVAQGHADSVGMGLEGLYIYILNYSLFWGSMTNMTRRVTFVMCAKYGL